jgi:ABC-type sugar transport system substrate-binding protein
MHLSGRSSSERGNFRVMLCAGFAAALFVSVWSSGTVGAATHAGSSALAQNIQKARNLVRQEEKRPTTIPLKVPISKPIPTGKVIDYISVGLPAPLVNSAITEGVKLLGWKLNILQGNGSPQAVLSAWAQILQQKPAGVIYAGFDQSLSSADLLKAKQEGIAVAGCCANATETGGINYFAETDSQQAKQVGPNLAELALAQSVGNTPPKVLVVSDPEYTVLTAIGAGFTTEYKHLCSSCSVSQLKMPTTSIGTNGPSLIVSYLRAHPSIKLLVMTLDALSTGLPAALSAAGMNSVKFIGTIPSPASLPEIHSGIEIGDIDFDDALVYLAQLDALARKFAGVPLQPPVTEPLWIMTKSNLPNLTALVPDDPNVYSQFAKLWGK